jgi:hypothetical protein
VCQWLVFAGCCGEKMVGGSDEVGLEGVLEGMVLCWVQLRVELRRL